LKKKYLEMNYWKEGARGGEETLEEKMRSEASGEITRKMAHLLACMSSDGREKFRGETLDAFRPIHSALTAIKW